MLRPSLQPCTWLALIVLSLQPAMAAPVPTPAPAPAPAAPAAQRSTPDPAAFDALLERLLGPELWREPTQQAVLARLAELHGLLPAGDPARTLRYRALRCDWDFENDPSGQLAYADAGLARARALRDGAMEASFLYCRSAAIEALRNMPAAMPDIEAGIAIARRIGDQRLLADGLSLRGGTRSLLGDQSLAIPDLLESQRLYQHAGFRDDAESLLQDIAISYRRMGDLDKAQEYFEQNEAYARELGDWSQLISNLLQQGYLAEDQGRLDDALAHYREVLALARKHDSDYDVASAYLAMAWPWMLRGDFDRGLAMVLRARTGYASLGDDSNDDMVYLRLGQARAGLGDHAQALAYFNRAAEALERSDNRRYLALLHRARAQSEQAMGRYQDAFNDLQRYVALHEATTSAERGQQAQLLRSQFDSNRQELENNRLANEQALRERQLAVLRESQRWQWIAMALGSVLVLLLALLVMRQLARMKRLREIASTDPLTGVANRRSIEQLGDEAMARTRAAGGRLCALALDVDHFKQVNDGHGHLTGDQVLARIATNLRHVLRHFDLLGRIGGEEFLVMLPDTGLDRAEAIAERLRAAIEAMDCSDIAEGLAATVSIGVACLGPSDDSLQALVARADAALYRAKREGRNRIVVDRS